MLILFNRLGTLAKCVISISILIAISTGVFAGGHAPHKKRDQVEKVAEKLIQEIVVNYKARQVHSFTAMLSSDFVPNTAIVKEVQEEDFETFSNLYLDVRIIDTKVRNSRLMVEVDWKKRWIRILNGEVIKLRGKSTLFFDGVTLNSRLRRIKGDQLFGEF